MTTAIATLNIEATQTTSATTTNHDDFNAMYEIYYTKVFAFIYSRTRDVELSKDLASGVFERAYLKGHEVRDPNAYGAWLFMVARNLIAGHFRKSAREQNHMERAGEELRFVDGPPAPEECLLRDERISLLLQHVKTLPRRDQELLSLKFDGEMTNTEIGQIMKMSPLNVRVSIFRALKRLRARMERGEMADLAEAA